MTWIINAAFTHKEINPQAINCQWKPSIVALIKGPQIRLGENAESWTAMKHFDCKEAEQQEMDWKVQ